MSASRLLSLTAAASCATASDLAFADGSFRFSPFSSSPPGEPPPIPEVSKGGFDPESLERGAKVLREINSSPHVKQDKQRKWVEDQRNLYQQQTQAKAQMLRYEDELALKRMQTYHEAQRHHNAELVQIQELSSIRKEQARRATEEQIERETIRVKAMAESEGRAHQAELTEYHNRRMLLEQINGEREKWLAAINTTFSHFLGGFRISLTERSRLVMTIGGATALAAGVYTTREGARVTWGYINRILGQPSLILEPSMVKFPWSGGGSSAMSKVLNYSTAAGAAASARSNSTLGDVILHPSLQKRIEYLAWAI